MNTPLVRRNLGSLVAAVLAAHLSWGAEPPRAPSGKAPVSSTAQRSAATRSGSAKGPLPDPALLDGATQPVEKKSEHGMIGDFELPGDENARNGKVGGPQDQNPANAGGQNSNAQGQPQGSGGGGPQAQQQGGASQPEGAQPQQGGAQPAGGTQAGGPQNPSGAGNPGAGAGDPGAQPQGIQVAELGGAQSGQQGEAGAPGGKPQAVGIGDKAMRIDQTANAQGVVGVQQQQAAGHTQQHDKGTGSGGKGSSAGQGPGRVEKGRVIPAGL